MSNREIPRGLRDLLPDEVRTRRNMEKTAVDLFKSYGYEEVITPTFEFMEVVEEGTGGNIREELFLFMDREGGILSLRPEMTTSIARLTATHLQDEYFPRRLYYVANVFRHVQPQLAQYREFWQMGVELLGAPGPWADAEVITLAVKAMQELGVNNFKVSINQIGIFNSLLDDQGINSSARNDIRRMVENKDLVQLSAVLEALPVEDGLKETIASLPVLHGGLEILNKIPYVSKNKNASLAVEELLKVYDALKAFGVQEHIVIDMGVLRGLDYYTGVEFEGYSPDLGYGLLGGGRYDRLLGKFGFPCPATGFALGMDRLALVAGQQEEKITHYVIGGTDYQTMTRKADELRQKGYIAELDLDANSREVLEQKLKYRKNYILVYV
ncbi:MAG TPA: ATP phosphoribosyltransferase regulatory subunit [Syntrophomonadaceae bacterium]|nr:ATP phosphoribosyltransferase regulatory subunit [Syntrophomonadaceae bacterium]